MSKKISVSLSKDVRELCCTCHLTCCHWKSCKFVFHFHLYKTYHGPVIASFSAQILKCLLLFLLLRWMWLINIQLFLLNVLYGNYNAQGAFVIIVFMCRNLLNNSEVFAVIILLSNIPNSQLYRASRYKRVPFGG